MHEDERTASFGPHDEISAESVDLQPGERVGNYVIRERIGEGGFAIVYVAQQEKPVKRRVALKMIKPGMDTKQVIARFEAERQALAVMDHPCVAKVFDAGATKTGRPYFVMEYVAGTPITEYCDRNRLSIEERLQQFMQVCRAVQHAHQKGIIHRDIKPSNVLVHADGKGTPKVIDFGVAKAVSHPLTEKTIYTRQGQLIGTPEYMSPEQSEMTAENVDTRADIYSLGVLLYELLTGTLPFDSKTLREAPFVEVQRIIREDEPPKPSTRLSRLEGDSVPFAQKRRTDPGSLQRELRGDLDWITMKALEKDRTRRYETAYGLALDIQRHLDNQPVLAGPPSAAYRLRKFVRRNRASVLAAGVVLAALLGGLAGTSWGLLGAIRARAETQRRAAELETVMEFQQSILAEIDVELMGRDIHHALRSEINEESTTELVFAFDEAVAQANMTDVARQVIDRNILARATSTIAEQFGDQPAVEAALRQTIGDTYLELGLYPQALPQMERALDLRRRLLGADDPDTLTSIGNMGRLLVRMGRREEAERYYREALEGRRRVLGDEHQDTLTSINNMGYALQAMGRLQEAELYFRDAMEGRRRVLGEDHRETISSINNVGYVLKRLGKLEEAEPYYREALERGRRVLGNDDPDTLTWVNNMAFLLRSMGKIEEAESYFREALDGRRRVLGDEHPLTLDSLNSMGFLLMLKGELNEAQTYIRRTLDVRRSILGDDHPDTLTSLSDMGRLLQSLGKPKESEMYHREAIERGRRTLPEGHWLMARVLYPYGEMLLAEQRYAEAEEMLFEAYGIYEASMGAEHERTRKVVTLLIDLFETWDEPEQTAEWRAKLAEIEATEEAEQAD